MSKNDRDKIQEVISKTEDHFEGKLTYISAGALGLTLTFIEKIIPLDDSSSVSFLIIGWSLLVLTLMLNLSSHLISKYFLNKTLLELDKNEGSKYIKSLYLKVIKRNKKIDCINWITVVLLILGISSIVVFVSINSMRKTSNYDHRVKQNRTINKTQDSTNSIYHLNNFYYGK